MSPRDVWDTAIDENKRNEAPRVGKRREIIKRGGDIWRRRERDRRDGDCCIRKKKRTAVRYTIEGDRSSSLLKKHCALNARKGHFTQKDECFHDDKALTIRLLHFIPWNFLEPRLLNFTVAQCARNCVLPPHAIHLFYGTCAPTN